MTTAIIVQPEAEADLRRAYRWYEAQRAGLGDEFLEQVDKAFARIAIDPFGPRPRHRGTRRIELRRFPYVVLYSPRGDSAFVLAVLHGRRNPRLFGARIRDFGS